MLLPEIPQIEGLIWLIVIFTGMWLLQKLVFKYLEKKNYIRNRRPLEGKI